jgi:hypothetical protein
MPLICRSRPLLSLHMVLRFPCCLAEHNRQLVRALALVAAALVQLLVGSNSSAAGAETVFDASPGPRTRRVYHATRIAGEPPIIDGKLDDACWTGAGEWSGNYTQQEPHEGEAPTQPTELKLVHDDRHLYVAIRAFDSELASVPHLRGRRDEFTGDMVGITFDSYHDLRTAFEFNVTSGGSKIDLQIRDLEIDLSWNAVWDVRVAHEAGAWTAEYRIPFSQLRYARQAEQVWGLHSWRWINRRQEESDWDPIPRDADDSGLVYEFGELRGIDGLPPSRRIELMPYAVAQYASSARVPGDPFRTGSETDFEVGLDAKLGLASDFTLDLTINPDFGQVEADPSEINLTTYETFFEERRPFFLEGQDVLDWTLGTDELFYSRRIGQPPSLEPTTTGFVDTPNTSSIRGAAKLTGKTRRGLAAGALYAETARTTARIDENGLRSTELVEPATRYGVTRLQQEIANGRTIIGGMATGTVRSFSASDPAAALLPRRAFTGGMDLLHRWQNREYEFDVEVMGSRVEGSAAAIANLMQAPVHNFQRPDADHVEVRTDARSLIGHGGRVRLGKVGGGRWRYSGNYSWRSPGLDLNDLGYLFEADRQRFVAAAEYVVTKPGRVLRNYEAEFAQHEVYDFGGTKIVSSTELTGLLRFNSDWTLTPQFSWASEERDTHLLRGGPSFLRPTFWEAGLRISSPGTKTWSWYVEGEREAETAGDSREHDLEAGFTWRALGMLTVQPVVEYESVRDDHQYVATATTAPGGEPRYVLGRMKQATLGTTLRVEVNFTPTLSLAWFGSLFASSGDFSQFKRVTSPRAGRYQDRFARLDGAITPSAGGDAFTVVDGTETYSFANPDFDLRELQSNLVLRWEYSAGSALYLVWTQNRVNTDRLRGFDRATEYRRLFSTHPDNTLLLKVSYWFAP